MPHDQPQGFIGWGFAEVEGRIDGEKHPYQRERHGDARHGQDRAAAIPKQVFERKRDEL